MENEKFVCAMCNKEFERPKLNLDECADTLKKQYLLNMCDDCFLEFLGQKEAQK